MFFDNLVIKSTKKAQKKFSIIMKIILWPSY